MLRIHSFDKDSKSLVFSVSSYLDFDLVNTLFSEIFSNIYIDWIYVLEELNEKNSIINKKLSVRIKEIGKENIVFISIFEEKTVAVVSS